jgi:hypothetical protein
MKNITHIVITIVNTAVIGVTNTYAQPVQTPSQFLAMLAAAAQQPDPGPALSNINPAHITTSNLILPF